MEIVKELANGSTIYHTNYGRRHYMVRGRNGGTTHHRTFRDALHAAQWC